MPRQSAMDMLAFIFLAAIWGGSFMLLRVTAPEIPPFPLILLRVASAALLLLPFMWRQQEIGAIFQHWRFMLVIGILSAALPFTLFAWSSHYLPAGIMAIINALMPIATAAFGVVIWKKKLRRQGWLGMGLALAGVVALRFVPSAETLSGLAILAGVVASTAYGLSANLRAYGPAEVSSLALVTGSMIFASLLLLLPGIYYWPSHAISGTAWLAALVLGVLCTGIGNVIMFNLLRRVGANKGANVTFLIPIFGMVWGWLLLGEAITINMVLSAAMILIGVMLGLRSREQTG